MGLGILILTYIFVAIAVGIAGPILFYWISRKVVPFQAYSYKSYGLFWLSWILIAAATQFTVRLILSGTAAQEQADLELLNSAHNFQFIVGFIALVLLSHKLLGATWAKALKASVLYVVLLSILFVLFSFLFIFVGLGALLS